MKKLILLALAAVMMAGCEEQKGTKRKYYKKSADNTIFVIIDSCEYIVNKELYAFAYNEVGYETYTHKGNCKFCAKRRKKELQEIVEQLKDK